MGIKQLYNDNLRKLPNEYGDVFVMQSLPPPFLQLAPNSLKNFQMDLGSSLPFSIFDSYVDCFASWIPVDISFRKIFVFFKSTLLFKFISLFHFI